MTIENRSKTAKCRIGYFLPLQRLNDQAQEMAYVIVYLDYFYKTIFIVQYNIFTGPFSIVLYTKIINNLIVINFTFIARGVKSNFCRKIEYI